MKTRYQGKHEDEEDRKNRKWWINAWLSLFSLVVIGVSFLFILSAWKAEAVEQDAHEAQVLEEEQQARELEEKQNTVAQRSQEAHVLREPAERYRDAVPGCEDTQIVFSDLPEESLAPEIAAIGSYNGKYYSELNAIELRSDFPQNLKWLKQIIVHECAHALQSAVYPSHSEYSELMEVTNAIYGEIERAAPVHKAIIDSNSQGLELHADCITEVWLYENEGGSWGSLGYAEDVSEVCAGQGWSAAEDVLSGNKITLF